MIEHFDWHSLFQAFLMFVSAYFGTKHGTKNGTNG